MPYPHSEAIHWYYRVFMPVLQHNQLQPNKPEDWSRLQIWDGKSMQPAMREGFSGKPTEEEINRLFSLVQNRELFFFKLGEQTASLLTESDLITLTKEPVKPADPLLHQGPSLNVDIRRNEKILSVYNDDLRKYQEVLNVNEKHGTALWSAVDDYRAGRDWAHDEKEAASRKENNSLLQHKNMRARADRVISEMMAPRPGAPADIFFDSSKHATDAVIHYQHYEKDLKPNGYDLPKNEKLTDRDAATINFAMLFVASHMNPFIYAGGRYGVVAAEVASESGISMMITGLFAKSRMNQPLSYCLGEAMKMGKGAIEDYLGGNPSQLGQYLAESVQKIKQHLVGTGIQILTQDTVAGTKIIERILDLFEKNPDIWEATGLPEQERDFMRGYVQMGKVYDQFADSQMKFNEAHIKGTELSTEEKVEILADAALRRMVEKALAKEEKEVSEKEAFMNKIMEAQAKDAVANAKKIKWEQENAALKEKDPDAYNEEEEKQNKLLDYNAHSTLAFFQPVEHPILNKLGQPGMLERMRQSLMKDPFILEQAQKIPFAFNPNELAAGKDKYRKKMDALIDQVQPTLDKAEWLANLRSKLAQNADPNMVVDSGRFLIASSDGKKPLVSVVSGNQDLLNLDNETIDQLYEHAKNGNLYYYGKDENMPARLSADGTQASARQIARPTMWMRFANAITFGLAYAEACKTADAFDLFVKAKPADGMAAQNAEEAPKQEQQKETGKANEKKSELVEKAVKKQQPKQAKMTSALVKFEQSLNKYAESQPSIIDFTMGKNKSTREKVLDGMLKIARHSAAREVLHAIEKNPKDKADILANSYQHFDGMIQEIKEFLPKTFESNELDTLIQHGCFYQNSQGEPLGMKFDFIAETALENYQSWVTAGRTDNFLQRRFLRSPEANNAPNPHGKQYCKPLGVKTDVQQNQELEIPQKQEFMIPGMK